MLDVTALVSGSETAGDVPIRRNTTIPECVLHVINMSENSLDILGFLCCCVEAPFTQSTWFFHAEGTEDYIRGRDDVSSARDAWGAVMTATSTCLRVSEGTTGSKCPSKRACVVPTSRFFSPVDVVGMEDVSPANGVRGDVSGLHVFRVSKARMVPASVHGFSAH